jgi:hypothetical protein
MLQRVSLKLPESLDVPSEVQSRSDWGEWLVKARLGLTLVVIVPFLQALFRYMLQLYDVGYHLVDRGLEGIKQSLVRWGVIQTLRWIYCPRVLTVGERSLLFGASFATLLFINLLANGLYSYVVHKSWMFFTLVQFIFFSVPLLFSMRSIRSWVSSRGGVRPDEQLFRKQLRRKHRPLWYYLKVTWFMLTGELLKLATVTFWIIIASAFFGLPIYYKYF